MDSIGLEYRQLLLPVSAASVERSHSALRHVKTDKRANTGQDRMVALRLLFVHRDMPVDYEVIDKFASAHPRRMTFLNPLSDRRKHYKWIGDIMSYLGY